MPDPNALHGLSEHRFSRNYRAHCNCPNCEEERRRATKGLPERPTKLGLLVVAPDDTIRGAIVRRDGEDWHYEEKP